MNIWELPKEHYNWESPIKKIYGDIHNEMIRQDEENCMYTIKQSIGYEVDKEELIKALQYDREQYDKGYNDGRKETFVEELEKIKAEIKTQVNLDSPFISHGNVLGMEYAIALIDRHISKLNGENK